MPLDALHVSAALAAEAHQLITVEKPSKPLFRLQERKIVSIYHDYPDARDLAYQYLDGATPARRRQQAVDAFQAGQGALFLISLRAGGVGLNLTAADYAIHMDPWWNPAVEDQASDRAHRIGQERPVTVYRLVMRGTIEEKILDLHRQSATSPTACSKAQTQASACRSTKCWS